MHDVRLYYLIKGSKAVFNIRSIDEYGMDGELAESTTTKDGKEITAEEYDKLFAQLGEQVNLEAVMHEIEKEAPVSQTSLSDYAE